MGGSWCPSDCLHLVGLCLSTVVQAGLRKVEVMLFPTWPCAKISPYAFSTESSNSQARTAESRSPVPSPTKGLDVSQNALAAGICRFLKFSFVLMWWAVGYTSFSSTESYGFFCEFEAG